MGHTGQLPLNRASESGWEVIDVELGKVPLVTLPGILPPSENASLALKNKLASETEV